MAILVTGATGQLGSRVLRALGGLSAGVRGVSRRGRDGTEPLDLLTAGNLAHRFAGVDTIVHCAQSASKNDILMAHRLAQAARAAGVEHVVAISIVGIEDIPLGYYRQRRLIEHALVAGFPRLTIQRATQFHTLVNSLLSAQRRLPVMLLPKIRVQPVSVDIVATRLVTLAHGPALGRAEDIGGPEILWMREMFRAWQSATGHRRRALDVRLPGKTFRAFAAGANLAPTSKVGTGTFEEFLTAKYGNRAA